MLANILKGASSVADVPIFRSMADATSSAGSLSITVNRPTGVVAGDLLIAVYTVQGDDAGFNNPYLDGSPTGFSVVRQSGDSSTDNLYVIASKIATGSEPTTYTFDVATSSADAPVGSLIMLAYQNATRVNTIGDFNRTSSSTATANSISPSYLGTLLFVAVGSRLSDGSSITIATPPANMVQRADDLVSASSSRQRTAVYDQSPLYPGATGTRSLVWSGATRSAGLLLQITNEPTIAPEFVASATTQNGTTGTNLVINRPTGTIEGDLMVAVMASNGALTGGWTDTTFTEAADQGAVSPSLRVAYKVAGASEPSNYTFSSADTDIKAGSIVTYRFASYNSISAFVTGADPLILTGATAAASQSILLAIGARAAANVTVLSTQPRGMTFVVANTDATAPSFGVASQVVPAGPTGFVARITGSTTDVAGLLITLSPTRSL
jgi:hypothetical protein